MSYVRINTGVCLNSRFLRMSPEAQSMYLAMILLADGNGMCDSFVVQQLTGRAEQDLNELVGNGFVIRIPDEQTVAIAHWLLHDPAALRRKQTTAYKSALRSLKTSNGVYSLKGREENEKEQ